jgi:hypothetical protein
MGASIHFTPAGGAILETPFLQDFVAAIKREIPPRSRWWDNQEKQWHVDPSHAHTAARIFRAFFPGPESFQRPGATEPPTWAKTLYVQPDAPLVVIEAAYKALAKVHHPDKGGNLAIAKQLNLAIEQARSVKSEGQKAV